MTERDRSTGAHHETLSLTPPPGLPISSNATAASAPMRIPWRVRWWRPKPMGSKATASPVCPPISHCSPAARSMAVPCPAAVRAAPGVLAIDAANGYAYPAIDLAILRSA